MSLLGYCYNIPFILLFVAASSACRTAYLRGKQKIFLDFFVLLCMYTFESILLTILAVGSFRNEEIFFVILSSAAEGYWMGKIVLNLFEKTGERMLAAVPLAATVLTVGCLLGAGRMGIFLERSGYSCMLLGFCGLYWYLLRRETDEARKKRAKIFGTLIQAMALLSILAILESVVYIWGIYAFMDQAIPYYGIQISIFEDIFCIFLSVWLLLFAKKEEEENLAQQIDRILQGRMDEARVDVREKVQKGQLRLEKFCRHLELTEREAQVLRLLLAGKDNQEVSEELYIALGTVKAHVHNIFSKAAVTKRSQLMTLFMDYEA